MRWIIVFGCLVAGLHAGEIQDAIAQLGASRYALREEGIAQLATLARSDHAAVLEACVSAYRATDDPEVKVRLRSAMQQIVDQYIYRAPRGFLGVRLNSGIINFGGKIIINGVTLPTTGIWVGSVIENSAADRAGIQANDFIHAVDGMENLQGTNFTAYIQSKRPGTPVKLTIVRGEATNVLELAVGEMPAETREQILSEQGGRDFFRNWLIERLGGSPKTNAAAPFGR